MKTFGITDIGKVRKENQDMFDIGVANKNVIGVVCDGMGGARSGNIASALATDCFVAHVQRCILDGDEVPFPSLVAEAAKYANVVVYDRAFTDFTCEGMGTTLVGGIFGPDRVHLAHIGDSRAYMISRGVIWQITTDHSYVEELVQRGEITREEAKTHPRRNYITKALGIERDVKPDVYTVEIEKGNIILLCSDGLTNMVDEEEMLEISQKHTEPEKMCTELLNLALSREATDNVTVAIFAY